MRHRVYGKHLGRNTNERKALFRNLVQSLFIHGHIQTTESKAKAIKGLVDKIINQAKNEESRRLLSSFITQPDVREKLVNEIAPNMKERDSGYTSIVKLGPRLGDNATIVRMDLIEDIKKPQEGKKVKVTEKKIVKETIEKPAKKLAKSGKIRGKKDDNK